MIRYAGAILTVALLAGCGPARERGDLRDAAAATEERGTARIEATLHADEAPDTCSGAVDYERSRWKMTCGGEGLEQLVFIAVGNTLYFRFPSDELDSSTLAERGKSWLKTNLDDEERTGVDPFALFNPSVLLEVLRAAARESEVVGDEDVDGRRMTHYRLVVDDAKLGDPDDGSTSSVDVWVDDQGLVRRFESRPTDDADGEAWTIEFSDFGVPVDIEPPPAEEVLDEDALAVEEAPEKLRCAGGPTSPLAADDVVAALRRHGFDAKLEPHGCLGEEGVVAFVSAFARGGGGGDTGTVFCEVRREAGARSGTLRLRGQEDEAVAFSVANVECTLLAERADEVATRLERALRELERSLR